MEIKGNIQTVKKVVTGNADTQRVTLRGNIGEDGGSRNYESLYNKPSINDVVLLGNKSLADLGIPTKLSEMDNDANYVQDADYVHTDNNFTDALKA